MRFLFAIKSLNVPGGGAERVLVQTANGLAGRGHQVAVLDFDAPGRSFYPLSPDVQRINLDVGPPGQPTPRLGLLRALPRMRAVARRWKPDLVVGFMHSMYVPLALALAGAGHRVLASEHAVPRHFASRGLQRRLVAGVQSLLVGTTVPSEAARKAQDPALRASTVVLPNPLPAAVFDEVAAAPVPSSRVVLCVGRFMEEKGHAVLLEAFDRIAARHPDWSLRLVGEGELRADLEALRAGLSSRDRIHLPGATRDIAAEYAACELVVVPSFHESFGMVTLEAQACARPVLGFGDCEGTRELVRHGDTGWLVDGGGDRVQGLADGLDRLLSDPGLRARLGAAGPHAAARFGPEQVLDAWERALCGFARGASAGDAVQDRTP